MHKATPFKERFEDKYIPEPMSGCWLWTAALGGGGYGQIMNNDKAYRAHRVSWEMQNGPIPDGQCVLHKCDIKICVNPQHLFLGTQKDNVDDCIAKGRRNNVRGEDSGMAKLTSEEVIAIYNTDMRQHDIARKYGVSQTVVSSIKRGHTWVHVTEHTKGVRAKTKRMPDEQINKIYNAAGTYLDIARNMGVPKISVWRIKTGRIWADVTGHNKVIAR